MVERPASVVKELLENAIDAGADRISVLLKGGGKSLIEVRDNGCGMTEEEALLAVERHTTSKIKEEEDLFNIRTLGFRGEALFAISSVSMFTLTTRAQGEELATKVVIEGGVLKSVAKCHREEVGTTVRVKNLFFNLKARRGFLKSNYIESQHSKKVVLEYAMAYPRIAFELKDEGGWIRLEPSPLKKRLEEIRKAPVVKEAGGEHTRLFLIDDGRGEVFLFVNKRAVTDRTFGYQLRRLCRQAMGHHSPPTAVLFVEVNPSLVDVNVHPTKREVRFKNKEALSAEVESLFNQERPTYSLPATGAAPLREPGITYVQASQQRLMEVMEVPYRYIGELSRTFLLFEDQEGALLVVDKHALHEHLIFSRIREQKEAVPAFIPADEEITKWKEFLEAMGFSVDEENGVITAVPRWAHGIEERVLREIAHSLKEEEPENPQHQEIARIACRAAVKAGDRTTSLDATTVANILKEKGLSITCPHGRPVVVKLERKDIERWFKRRK